VCLQGEALAANTSRLKLTIVYLVLRVARSRWPKAGEEQLKMTGTSVVSTPRARYLKCLSAGTGVSCIAIGAYHFALGTASVPGATDANATVDSRERFYSAIFAGYGIAWMGAARKSPIRADDVRLLATLLLAGGMGRLLSRLLNGPPHWFQDVLTAVEFAVPAIFFGLLTRRRTS
jgi:hypothetical protein